MKYYIEVENDFILVFGATPAEELNEGQIEIPEELATRIHLPAKIVRDPNGAIIDVELLPKPEPPSQPLTEEQQRLLDLELAMAQILGGGGGV